MECIDSVLYTYAAEVVRRLQELKVTVSDRCADLQALLYTVVNPDGSTPRNVRHLMMMKSAYV